MRAHKAVEGASRLPTEQDQAQKSSEPPQASREPIRTGRTRDNHPLTPAKANEAQDEYLYL